MFSLHNKLTAQERGIGVLWLSHSDTVDNRLTLINNFNILCAPLLAIILITALRIRRLTFDH